MPQEEKLLDATGMDCARVILGLKKALIEINSGQILKVVATDPLAPRVLEGFTRQTRQILLKQTQNGTAFIILCAKDMISQTSQHIQKAIGRTAGNSIRGLIVYLQGNDCSG